MKNLLMIALLGLAGGTSAYAAPSFCHDGLDHGYTIQFSEDMALAEVSLSTIMDTKVVANLECRGADVAPPSEPDGILVLAMCSEPHIADAGYSVVVKQNEANGQVGATLSEVTFFGSNPIAEMRCQ